MTKRFTLKAPLAANTNVDLDDSMRTKLALRRLGYYSTPGYGMTPYPDAQLFKAVADLQRDKGIRRTGEVRPGDDTEKAIRVALSETTPNASENSDKKGKYIWRTRGDSNVRSAHAERDGRVFEWNNPPEGGHPGEAPNCRCRAENVTDNKAECSRLKAQLEVDSANIEIAREVYENATRLLNQTIENIERNSKERDQLMKHALAEFGKTAIEALTGRASPGTLTGLAVLAAKYSELEFEYARLSDRHDELVVEQEFALENINEAKAIRAATQAKFDSLGCGSQ